MSCQILLQSVTVLLNYDRVEYQIHLSTDNFLVGYQFSLQGMRRESGNLCSRSTRIVVHCSHSVQGWHSKLDHELFADHESNSCHANSVKNQFDVSWSHGNIWYTCTACTNHELRNHREWIAYHG